MRIAVWHNLPSGGGKRALYYHVRGLLERGHTVESWCPPTADQSYLRLSELIPEHVVSVSVRRNSGSNGRSNAITAYRDLLERIRAMDEHCRECAEQINRDGFDVVFANACMFFRVPSVAHYAQIPAVIYLPEPYRWLYEALPRLPWIAFPAPEGPWWSPRYLKHWIGNLIRVQGFRVQARDEMLNAQSFVSILVNSLFSRESVLRAYGLDAKVCYLGIDTKLFCTKKTQRESFVVGMGAFVPEKNVHFIVRALAHVNGSRPRLVWVANSVSAPYWKEMMWLAGSVGVDLEVKEKIRDSEIVDILNRAGVMAYAPRLEPFGFAPLEANACGLPVVAVAEGGVRETVTHEVNGLVVEHDPRAMGAAIQHLLDHKDYACELGENGCKLVRERWSLGAAVSRLEKRLVEAMQPRVSNRRG